MRTAKFSYFQSLRFGWETWKHNVWFLIGITLLFIVVAFLPSLVGGLLMAIPSSDSLEVVLQVFVFILYIAGYVLQLVMGIGLLKILLNFCDQKKSTVADLFRVRGVFWRYVGGTILYGLLVIAGTFLLIIPGIYWALRYLFVPLLIIDKNMSIGEAFRQSSALSKNTKWNFVLYGVFLGLLNLGYLIGFVLMFFGGITTLGNPVLGITLLVLGFLLMAAALFITLPIVWLAYTHAYRTTAYTTQAGFDVDRQKGVTVSGGEHATKVVMVVVFVLVILFFIALSGWAITRFILLSKYQSYPALQYQDFSAVPAPDVSAYMLEDGTVDTEALQKAYNEGAFGEVLSGEAPVEAQ